MTNAPQTYNDARLDEVSREVFFKALTAGEKMLDKEEPFNSEKLHALAALADAAAGGFQPEGEEESYE